MQSNLSLRSRNIDVAVTASQMAVRCAITVFLCLALSYTHLPLQAAAESDTPCSPGKSGQGCMEPESVKPPFGPPNPLPRCSDGLDNDSDQLVDAADPGCWKDPNDPTSYNPVGFRESAATSQCQDGIDNDKDMVADANDPACWSDPSDPSTYDPRLYDESVATTECQDGLDNDGNGLSDMADPGCDSATDNDESGYIVEPAPVTVSVECMTENADGTKTAYFSFNNSTGVELFVSTNKDLGTVNEFVGSSIASTPPTTFKAGQSIGTVVATFTGDEMYWIVQPPKGASSTAYVYPSTPRCAAVQPKAECRGYLSGIMTVRMGYFNPNSFDMHFAIGANNTFLPGSANRGQPTRFFSGSNKAAFQIQLTSDAEAVVYNLNGAMTSIDASLPVCEGLCVDTPTGTITGNIDQIASDLSELMNRAASLLASARKNLTPMQIKRNRQDAQRAKRKALVYEQEAKTLTVQFPAVAKTCPEAPQFCTSVDRGSTLDGLRNLYANQLNTIKRSIARTYWRNINRTRRGDRLVEQAKTLAAQGFAEINKLPRLAVECK